MIEVIAPLAERIITVTPNSYRAEDSHELNSIIKKYNSSTEACESYAEAYGKALGYYQKGDMILACGSLYMIGDMRKIIRTWKY
jgi:dihydrofolate synthase/folylpolyglutamate synthase